MAYVSAKSVTGHETCTELNTVCFQVAAQRKKQLPITGHIRRNKIQRIYSYVKYFS